MINYLELYTSKKEVFQELWSSLRNDNLIRLKELLTESPELINIPVYGGTPASESLFHYAADSGSKDVCMYFIDNGMNINELSRSYLTPLESLASVGDYELVKTFISKGAWVDGDSRGFLTPLISAVCNNHIKIVEYLIEKGADVNRMHTMSNLTPLDLAKDEKIIELLKSNGALKAHEKFDLSKERASGVLWQIHNEAGWVLSSALSKNTIDVRIALLKKDKKYKLLFTIGMYQKPPRLELLISIPYNWPVNQQLMAENNNYSFPIQLLFCLAEYRLADGELHEGYVVDKEDSRWKHLVWPEKIDGFIAVNYSFIDEPESFEPDDDIVTLLLLVPIKYPKTGCPKGKKLEDWVEKHRTVKWARNSLKHEHLNEEERIITIG